MWRNAYETYWEDSILSADPLELVHLLYQACISAVGDARNHLAEGRILERSVAISKACNILMELNGSLDYKRGGPLSHRLADLYGYMHRRLVEANFKQSDDILAEVSGLLETLQEAWEGVRQKGPREAPPESTWMQAISQVPELAQASGGWSL